MKNDIKTNTNAMQTTPTNTAKQAAKQQNKTHKTTQTPITRKTKANNNTAKQ